MLGVRAGTGTTIERPWVKCARYDREGDAYACARRLDRAGRFNVRVREGDDGRTEVWQQKRTGGK